MSATSPALVPGRGERLLRAALVLYVLLLVALPLLTLVPLAFSQGINVAWSRITGPAALHALWLTLWTAALVGVLNVFLGTATAWALVRYPVPGRQVISAMIDLPLAIPTLVAGLMIATLYGPESLVGQTFSRFGVDIVFASPAIILALLFVTLPFVIRAVAPLLAEVDPAEEEAATVLGASPWRTFQTVFLPTILPAALSGGIRSVGRAIGEFGSIVVVAGNIPMRTLTAPVYIFGEIESGAPQAAAALCVVLLAVALALHAGASWAESRSGVNRASH